MVWVDAAAVLMGMILLVATVGGVVLVEPEPEPITWDYSFFEGTSKEKHCVGLKNTLRAGCTQIIQARPAVEGVEMDTVFNPLTLPNVTSVTFTLTWVDDTPTTEKPDCTTDCDRSFEYTNESTDTLRVTITPPIGEPQTIEGTSNIDSKLGILVLRWTYLPMPEAGTLKTFTQLEAMEQLNATYLNPQHDALGIWKAQVVVVRAGDQEGSLPMDACSEAPVDPSTLPNDAGDNCNLEDDQGTIERGPVAPPPQYYKASYDDKGNPWLLEMAVRTYAAQTSLAG